MKIVKLKDIFIIINQVHCASGPDHRDTDSC